MAAKLPIEAARRAPARRTLTARDAGDGCPGCGIVLSGTVAAMHAYHGASGACWELFQRLAQPSTAQPDTARVRRLMHDAYAAQHPGPRQKRSVQSVAVHLMDLCLLLERAGEIRRLVPVLGRMPPRRRLELHWLEPPKVRGTITIVDALHADDTAGRAADVEAWARDVWAAWAPHHATVRRWLDAPRA